MDDVDGTRRLLFERHAAFCGVFSHRLRLELLDALRDGELTVGELAKLVDAGTSNVSQHLAVMRERGVVLGRQEGVRVYYRVADRRVFAAFGLLRELLLEQVRRDGSLLVGETLVEGPVEGDAT